MKFRQSLVLLFSLTFSIVDQSFANISIESSRIVFNADESSKSVGVSNRSKYKPYLVSINISRDISGNLIDTPLMATPVLFRIEPGSSNKIRILKKLNTLPNDRESLFYFNAMAIPSSETGEAEKTATGLLQIATGNTIKLFYRPEELIFTQKESMGKLKFIKDEEGVKVSNPTPYYISLAKLVIDNNKVSLNVIDGSSMIAPFSDYTYSVNVSHGKKVEWSAINDYGGAESFNGTIY